MKINHKTVVPENFKDKNEKDDEKSENDRNII